MLGPNRWNRTCLATEAQTVRLAPSGGLEREKRAREHVGRARVFHLAGPSLRIDYSPGRSKGHTCCVGLDRNTADKMPRPRGIR